MDARTVTPLILSKDRKVLDRAKVPSMRKDFEKFSVIESPHWARLDDDLHELTAVVGHQSEGLERTTILTWLYANAGFCSFLEIVDRYSSYDTPTVKKRQVRRTLRNMHRLDLIRLFVHPSSSLATADPSEQDASDEEADGVSIGASTCVHIGPEGMKWLRRAFKARLVGMGGVKAKLNWVHQSYLDEEEEGKGTDPFWVETMGSMDPNKTTLAPNGEISSWVGPRVASVFELSLSISHQPKATSGTSKTPRKRRT